MPWREIVRSVGVAFWARPVQNPVTLSSGNGPMSHLIGRGIKAPNQPRALNPLVSDIVIPDQLSNTKDGAKTAKTIAYLVS
jgi:hypothetical protein